VARAPASGVPMKRVASGRKGQGTGRQMPEAMTPGWTATVSVLRRASYRVNRTLHSLATWYSAMPVRVRVGRCSASHSSALAP